MQGSADQKRVAYALDLTGEEQYEVYSKDIANGLVTQLTRKSDSSGSIAWAMDNITLFYITLVRTSSFSKCFQQHLCSAD